MITVKRGHVWATALIGSALVLIGYGQAGLSIAVATALPYFLMIALLVSVAIARRSIDQPRQRRIADLVEALGLFCWVSALGGLASYAVAAGSIGFEDAALARADQAIGFDWPGAYHLASAHPWFATIAGLAYRSIFITPLVIVAALALTERVARAWTFIALFAAALAISLATFHFWPARSALAFHIGMRPDYLPATGIDHVAIITALRSGALTVVDPARIVGLITFPSFHAVSAVLFSWAGWSVRRIRMPLAMVNGGMLIVTPVEGTHYLVDILAGILLAASLIAVVHWRSITRSLGAGRVSEPTMIAA